MERKIYLDNNASTPIDKDVLQDIKNFLEYSVGNASSIHSYGRFLNQLLLSSRDTIATYLNVKSNEIIFTSGATESANMFLKGYFAKNPSGHIITSDLEHPCVYKTLQYLESKGLSVTYLKGGQHGAITLDQVKEAIRPDTRLIALMASNNETGVKTDISAIAQLAEKHGIQFFVDAVAFYGKEKFEIPSGISALSISGHKIHAPKGVGLLFVRKNLKLEPLLHGGEHEYGRRAGTENIIGILALSRAIEIVHKNLDINLPKIKSLRDRFEEKLFTTLDKIKINGLGERICNTSNIVFEGIDGEVLLAALDNEGIAASHGSACSSGATEPSRILLNMGLSIADASSSIRFSFSKMNTDDEVEEAAEIIIRLIQNLRKSFLK